MVHDGFWKLSILTLAVVGATFPSAAPANECWDYTKHGFGEPVELPEGYPQAMAAHGNYLYVGIRENSWLVVLDTSQPGAPVIVDQHELAARPFGLYAAGDLLFVSQSTPHSLAIYSLDDPARPQLIATIDGVGNRDGIERFDDYLYITGAGVSIYDITNPDAPALVSTFLEGEYCLSLERVGDHLYVAHPGSILVFDLTDPLAPAVVGEVAFSNPSVMLPIGDLLYVAAHGGIGTVDVSDPAEPLLLASLTAAFNPDALALVGDHLIYLNNGDVDVYDVSDPTDIQYLWERPELWIAKDAYIGDGTLYLAHRTQDGSAQLEVYDVDVPIFPYQRVVDLPWFAEGMEVRAGLGYIAAGYGLTIVDYAAPGGPQVLSQLEVSDEWWYRKIALGWPYVVLAEHQFDPMYVIDVTDPAQPVVTEAYPVDDTVKDIELHGSHLYVAAGNDGVLAYEIVDGALQFRDSYFMGYYVCYDVEIAGEYLLARTASDLYVFDISDPDELDRVAYLQAGTGLPIEVHGQYMFEFGLELSIWDIADPTQPVLLGSCPVSGHTVAVVGPTAYVASSSGWVHAVDISDPTTPTRLGSLPATGYVTDVDLVGESIVVQSRYGGGYSWIAWLQCPDAVPVMVMSFDLTVTDDGVAAEWRLAEVDPVDVVLVRTAAGVATRVAHSHLGGGRYEAFDHWLPGDHARRTYDLILQGDVVYQQSIVVDLPPQPLAVQISPNPFNPQAMITFDLPHESWVVLSVFDPGGHRVRELVSGARKPAGRYKVAWDGRDAAGRTMPSGTYLVRIETDTGIDTSKATLVR